MFPVDALVVCPTLAPVRVRGILTEFHGLFGYRLLLNPVHLDPIPLLPTWRGRKGENFLGIIPRSLPRDGVRLATRDWRQEHDVANGVEVEQIGSLGFRRFSQLLRRRSAGFHLGDGLKERDSPEVCHFEPGLPGHEPAKDWAMVQRLVELGLGTFCAERAEPVPPSQGELHDRKISLVSGDVPVYRWHGCVGGWEWNRQVLEDDCCSQNQRKRRTVAWPSQLR